MGAYVVISACLFALGMAAGSILNAFFYRRILRMCAEQRTPEKIGNQFYYIVPEVVWNTYIYCLHSDSAAKLQQLWKEALN
jgi:hypothetical protein